MGWRDLAFIAALLAALSAPITYATLSKSSSPWHLALLLGWLLLAAGLSALALIHRKP